MKVKQSATNKVLKEYVQGLKYYERNMFHGAEKYVGIKNGIDIMRSQDKNTVKTGEKILSDIYDEWLTEDDE